MSCKILVRKFPKVNGIARGEQFCAECCADHLALLPGDKLQQMTHYRAKRKNRQSTRGATNKRHRARNARQLLLIESRIRKCAALVFAKLGLLTTPRKNALYTKHFGFA